MVWRLGYIHDRPCCKARLFHPIFSNHHHTASNFCDLPRRKPSMAKSLCCKIGNVMRFVFASSVCNIWKKRNLTACLGTWTAEASHGFFKRRKQYVAAATTQRSPPDIVSKYSQCYASIRRGSCPSAPFLAFLDKCGFNTCVTVCFNNTWFTRAHVLYLGQSGSALTCNQAYVEAQLW